MPHRNAKTRPLPDGAAFASFMSPFIEVQVLALVQELPAMSESLAPEDFKRAALTRFQEIVSVAPAYDPDEINNVVKEYREIYGW